MSPADAGAMISFLGELVKIATLLLSHPAPIAKAASLRRSLEMQAKAEGSWAAMIASRNAKPRIK